MCEIEQTFATGGVTRSDPKGVGLWLKHHVRALAATGPAEQPRRAAGTEDNQRAVRGVHRGSCEEKKKTWKEDRSDLKRHVLSKLSGRLAVSLVTADIEAIHSQLGVAHPYGANDVLKVIRKMFNGTADVRA